MSRNHRRRGRRVFYLATVASERLNRRYGQHVYVGPASKKVFSICEALRCVGVQSVVVSNGFSSGITGLKCVPRNAGRVPFVSVFSLGRRGLKRLTSALGFLLAGIRLCRRSDVIVLYNFSPEYLPLAIYRWLIGAAVVLDLEDAPRSDEAGLRGAMTKFSFWAIKSLAAPHIITVSKRMAEELGLRDTLAVYGTCKETNRVEEVARFGSESVTILYGGAIIPDTGSELFVATVQMLAEQPPARPVEFLVTGLLEAGVLDELSNQPHGDVRVTLRPALSADEYEQLLTRVDVGLCLKLPSRKMGQTTFPSKVIEYAGEGILVCSTLVSDVPYIFDDATALLLKSESAKELTAMLRDVVARADHYAARASAGQRAIRARFDPEQVGRELGEFLLGRV